MGSSCSLLFFYSSSSFCSSEWCHADQNLFNRGFNTKFINIFLVFSFWDFVESGRTLIVF